MKVLIAEHAGFCFGVEKAINKACEEIENHQNEDGTVYSLGPIIHNRQVVSQLENDGLVTVNDVKEASKGSVIIRSHGVPARVYDDIKMKGLRLVDATCPFVKRIQHIVSEHHEKGHRIVIIGNEAHPEVIGINGWCDNTGVIVGSVKEVNTVPENSTLCVVAQTTIPINVWREIRQKLKESSQEIHWYNTICLATQDRQESARDLAKKVNYMVVIGGSHSSNTKKLAEVCEVYLPKHTYLIESYADLPLGFFEASGIIGITAGASTPKRAIDETVKLLESLVPGRLWQIAIDGPAGAGKSTIAKKLANRLGFTYIDTGAMYRAITLYLLQHECHLEDTKHIEALAVEAEISFYENKVFLKGQDVTEQIRSAEVTQGVSLVASKKEVRQHLVNLQQSIAQESHVVMDGRDIGTVVLPKATLKIFLTATVEERARRRFEEIKHESNETYEDIKQQIAQRDHADETRQHDPLIPAIDAVQIDSTRLSIDEVVEKIIILFCKVFILEKEKIN